MMPNEWTTDRGSNQDDKQQPATPRTDALAAKSEYQGAYLHLCRQLERELALAKSAGLRSEPTEAMIDAAWAELQQWAAAAGEWQREQAACILRAALGCAERQFDKVETPRTDAEAGEAVFTETGCAADVVNADFARQLERELAITQEQLERFQNAMAKEAANSCSREQQSLVDALTDACALIDGFKQGECWSEWDESVRRRLSEILASVIRCAPSAGLRGEQASYRIGYVDGATGKPPQVELTGPEKALCTPSHGALVPNCIALDDCQYPHICKHRNECFWIKGTDATDRGVKP
jgi:hypothetical protein